MSDRPRLLTRNFLWVCLAFTAFFLANHLLTPTLPMVLQQARPWEPWEFGIMLSAFMLASIVMRPFVGKWCEESDPRRWMRLGALLFVGLPLLYPWVAALPFPLLAVRILHGVGFAFFYTAATTFLSLEIPAQRRAEGMSHFSNAIKLAMAIGPAAGLYLVTHQLEPWLFGIAATCAGIALVLVLGLTPPAAKADSPAKPRSGLLINRQAIFPGVVMASNSVVFGTLIPFLPQLAAEKNLLGEIAWFYPIYALSLIFSRAVTGPLSDQYGREKIVIPGMLGVCVSLLLLALAVHPGFFLVSAACYGLCAGTVQPSLMALAVDRSPAERRGSAMATFTLFTDIGIATGTFLTAMVGERFGYGWAIYGVLAITLAGLGYFWGSLRFRERGNDHVYA
jgi:MFS family permease